MNDFRKRIEKLSPKGLALLALELESRLEALERDQSEPLAVVGAGCRIPRAGSGSGQFWSLLSAGKDAVSQVPQDRWNASAWYDSDPDAPGRISTTWGSFVSGVDLFDASFFNISAREAASIDPQHRILLESCWEAIENAGRSPRALYNSSTGVFVGLTNNDYHGILLGRGEKFLDTYVATGISPSVVSGRISYLLGLHGPSLTLDTACSASLVAVHLACQSLRQRECDMALAGGVNLMLSPDVSIALSKAHLMAPDGHSKTFDARADGFVRGEGCGVVVLKRLSDAERDGDRILALIRGSAVNQDGRSSGLTAPNGVAQEALLRQALANARLTANDIDYIEAHGTGTSLGDPIEAHALAAVFGPGRAPAHPLVVGSVKTNVGHLEAAAGVTGLIKTILSLENEYIPKHLHFRSMNPHIDWGSLAVEIPAEGRPWPRGERVRRAGVSSFGFSGTNAHVVVEEAPAARPRQPEWQRDWHILALSARRPGALGVQREQYQRELAETAAELGDICFTANAGRTHFEERTFYLGRDRAEMLEKVKQGALSGRKEGTVPVAFLFSGQGAQYAGMGEELYGSQPVFHRALDACAEILRGELSEPLLEVLWGSRTDLLGQTAYTQPALFAVEYGLAEVWRSWGIVPAMVAGHSVGEYVAACVAGVYGLEAGLKLIAARGRLMQECGGRGVMSAVRAGEERVRRALRGLETRVSIAAVNAPESVVIAGYEGEVEEVEKALRGEGVEWKRLAVSHGFHSPHMEEMEAALEAAAARQEYGPPQVKWISGMTGQQVGSESVDAKYWSRQARQPVRWAQAMESMEGEKAAIYLEVGPGSTLAGLGRQCVDAAERVWVTSLRNGRPEWEQMLESLGKMYVQGVEIDWEGYDRGYQRRRVALPTYPFERRRFWADGIDRRQPRSPASEPPSDWFYRLSWEPKPAVGYAGPAASGEAADFNSLKATAERLRIETGFDEYDKIHPLLDRICAAFIMRALRNLGCEPMPGMEIDSVSFARTLGISAPHLRIFDRLLAILAEEGITKRHGAKWVFEQSPETFDPVSECLTLESRFPAFRAEITMLRRCGEVLAEILSGRTDALQVLFSDGSFESAEELYTESPGLRVFNGLAASAVADEVRLRPGRKLRVLEIGAGTGATTGWIAAVLPPDRTEYCYTDISSAFLNRAKSKFKHYSFFQYRTLDIERDPGSQGFQPGQFDIVIASNVLHATADLRATMRNVRSLLAPSGVTLLVEGIRPERWVDLTFGLTEGWWRFRDHDLRASHPLISQAGWLDLLSATGLWGAGAVRAGNSQVAIILARAPHTEMAQRWLVIPDLVGVGLEFAALLTGLGGDFEMAGPEQSLAVLQKGRFDGVLYLAGLDCASSHELTGDSLDRAAVGTGTEILHIVQTMIECGGRLWMATRGAQHVGTSEPELNIAQAPIWGWAKTISLEHPNCGGGVVDLDPCASARESAIAIADAVFDEAIDNEDQVAIRNGTRFVPRLQRAGAPAAATTTLSKDKLYLITGGFGGLGLRLARWMAQRGARRLLLVGRTGLPARSTWNTFPADTAVGRQISAIREIERFGAEVLIRAADISDRQQAADLFADLPGQLGGIFHLAATGRMSSLKNMTSAGAREVMMPKTIATWNLHELSKDLDLDYFVMFSSWASVLGAQGLGHYNAANQFMDIVAHYRRTLSLPATSVNWGAWDEIRNASGDLLRDYERSGLRSMASDTAFTAMYRAANDGATQAIVADVDWQNLKALYEVRRPRPILELACNVVEAASVQSSAGRESTSEPDMVEAREGNEFQPVSVRTQILGSPTGERASRLVSYLTSVLTSVIGAPGQQLPAAIPTNELGLDSLMALEARNRVNSELEINIPAVRFLQGLTITELAARIGAELPDSTAEPHSDDRAASIDSSNTADGSFALSFVQRTQWLVQRIVPDSYTLNCAFTAKSSPIVRFDVFERAVWKLMAQHPALRTVIFETEDGEPRQRVLTSWRAETTLADAAGLTEQELADLVIREFQRAFDVRESVFRILVFRRNDCDIILFVFHHLVVDGTSVPLCFGGLRDIYTAELAGRPLQLAPPKASYREFVEWEAELVNGPGFQRLWDYWKGELSGDLPVLSLPSSHPRPAAFLPRGKRILLEFDCDLTRAIHDAARQSKTTTFSFLLAAFQILLCSYSGQDDLLVGTSSSTRDLAKWENTVGCFVNLLPVRCRLSRDEPFAEHLARTRETVLAALDHQDIPLSLLVKRLHIRRDFGCPPLFQAFFNYLTERPGNLGRFLLGLRDAAVPFGDSILTPWIEIRHDEIQSDAMMYFADFGEEIYAYMSYNADVVDEAVANGLAADYLSVIRAVVADSKILISRLPITSFIRRETECEELLL